MSEDERMSNGSERVASAPEQAPTAENDTPHTGFHCAEARAWHDNYDGMFWRWVECDTERLALKEALRRAELRLRIAEQDAELGRVIPSGTDLRAMQDSVNRMIDNVDRLTYRQERKA